MSKVSDLYKYCSYFNKVCLASIRGDMAKRVMHSILPSLVSPSQTYITEGVVDYKSLNYAISGRHDIIKYGTKACIDELQHYSGLYEDEVSVAKRLYASGDYKKSIEICLKCFQDEEGWAELFGGTAWERISKCILNLINLDKGLKEVQEKIKTKYSEEDAKAELNIKKMIVVELNVFDGLSHNTASVMEKVLKEEHKDKTKNNPNSKSSYEEELNSVRNIMDAKELSRYVDVFSEIEDELKGAGYLGAYKDYTSKLRNEPGYVKSDYENKISELTKIRLRKEMLRVIPQLNIIKDDFKREMSGEDNEMLDEVEIAHLCNKFSEAVWDVENILKSMSQEPKFKDSKMLKQFSESLNKIFDIVLVKQLAFDNEIYVKDAKKVYDMVSSVVFLLQSI